MSLHSGWNCNILTLEGSTKIKKPQTHKQTNKKTLKALVSVSWRQHLPIKIVIINGRDHITYEKYTLTGFCRVLAQRLCSKIDLPWQMSSHASKPNSSYFGMIPIPMIRSEEEMVSIKPSIPAIVKLAQHMNTSLLEISFQNSTLQDHSCLVLLGSQLDFLCSLTLSYWKQCKMNAKQFIKYNQCHTLLSLLPGVYNGIKCISCEYHSPT